MTRTTKPPQLAQAPQSAPPPPSPTTPRPPVSNPPATPDDRATAMLILIFAFSVTILPYLFIHLAALMLFEPHELCAIFPMADTIATMAPIAKIIVIVSINELVTELLVAVERPWARVLEWRPLRAVLSVAIIAALEQWIGRREVVRP